MKKTFIILFFFRICLGAIYFDSLLKDEIQSIILQNSSESIILNSSLELKHNFSLINENIEKINLEISSSGSLFSEENIQIIFKNLIFCLKENDFKQSLRFFHFIILIIDVDNFYKNLKRYFYNRDAKYIRRIIFLGASSF